MVAASQIFPFFEIPSETVRSAHSFSTPDAEASSNGGTAEEPFQSVSLAQFPSESQ
jgi:hypothetical protein